MASIAFIGDCHLGYRHRSKVQRMRDYVRAFEEAVDKAVDLNPDVVVFTGDLAHHSRPDPVSLRTILCRLLAVAQSRPVIVCIGNHEIEGHLGTTYSPIYGDVHGNIHVLSSEKPHAVIEVGGRKYGFHGFEYTRSAEMAQEKLKSLCGESSSDVNILCLHQAVERYLSPHEISLSALRQAAPSFNLMVFGHVHKQQPIREVFDVTPAYYCGSTERVSFNEAENDNGFLFFKDDDFQNPVRVSVASAPMTHIREALKGTPEKINGRIEELIKANPAELLKIELAVELEGDMIDVRRDWGAYETGRTVLEVSVTPKTAEFDVQFEKVSLSEHLIREYFQKSGNTNRELEDMCVDLFQRYSG